MFDLNRSNLARLDPQPLRELFTRPEHAAEGLTLLAGERPRPFHASTLYYLALAEPGTAAVAAAEADAARAAAQVAGAVEETLAESPEREALARAQAKAAEGRVQLAKDQAAQQRAEADLAAALAAGRNPKGLRQPVEAAKEAAGDTATWLAKLQADERAAAAALQRRREAARAELVAQRLADLAARREDLREKAAGAARALGAELLQLDALGRALGAAK
jgi:hypothetical protein